MHSSHQNWTKIMPFFSVSQKLQHPSYNLYKMLLPKWFLVKVGTMVNQLLSNSCIGCQSDKVSHLKSYFWHTKPSTTKGQPISRNSLSPTTHQDYSDHHRLIFLWNPKQLWLHMGIELSALQPQSYGMCYPGKKSLQPLFHLSSLRWRHIFSANPFSV